MKKEILSGKILSVGNFLIGIPTIVFGIFFYNYTLSFGEVNFIIPSIFIIGGLISVYQGYVVFNSVLMDAFPFSNKQLLIKATKNAIENSGIKRYVIKTEKNYLGETNVLFKFEFEKTNYRIKISRFSYILPKSFNSQRWMVRFEPKILNILVENIKRELNKK